MYVFLKTQGMEMLNKSPVNEHVNAEPPTEACADITPQLHGRHCATVVLFLRVPIHPQ